jgi:hypothetical protein
MPKLATINKLVSDASMELGIAQSPVSNAVNTRDQDIVQMVALLYAVADEILLEEPYKRSLGDGIWIADRNGVKKAEFTADDDLVLFDKRLAINGLKFRFLKAKGLEFGEELRDFSSRLNKLAGIVNGRVLDLDEEVDRDL